MDAGIIRSFKAFYRKNLVKFWLGLIGRKGLKANEMKPNLKQAIEFLDEAWSSVTHGLTTTLVSFPSIKKCPSITRKDI